MAMISCAECRKYISSEAKTCPNCGTSNVRAYSSNSSGSNTGWIVGIVIAIILLFGVIGNTGACSDPNRCTLCNGQATMGSGSNRVCSSCFYRVVLD